MNFKKMFLFLVLALFLAACGSNDEDAGANNNTNKNTKKATEKVEMTFFGESDNWRSEINIEQKGDKEKREFKLTYIGDDADSVDTVSYGADEPESFNKDDEKLNIQNYLTDNNTGKDPFYSDDSEIEVTVDWNDESETIQLEKE